MDNKRHFNHERPKSKVEVPQVETVEVIEKENHVGEVTGCAKLNVRTEPKLGSTILYVLDKGTKVTVGDLEIHSDFYEVQLSTGVKGFCMKKFITINS